MASGQGEHPAFGLVTELAHPFLFYYFVLSYQLFHLYSFPKNSFFFYTAVLSFLFSVYTDLSPVFFFSIISSFPLFFFCVALFTPPGFNMQSDLWLVLKVEIPDGLKTVVYFYIYSNRDDMGLLLWHCPYLSHYATFPTGCDSTHFSLSTQAPQPTPLRNIRGRQVCSTKSPQSHTVGHSLHSRQTRETQLKTKTSPRKPTTQHLTSGVVTANATLSLIILPPLVSKR